MVKIELSDVHKNAIIEAYYGLVGNRKSIASRIEAMAAKIQEIVNAAQINEIGVMHIAYVIYLTEIQQTPNIGDCVEFKWV